MGERDHLKLRLERVEELYKEGALTKDEYIQELKDIMSKKEDHTQSTEVSPQERAIDMFATGYAPGAGAGVSLRMDLQQKQVIASRYRLEKLLGNGGMGQVWLAEDISLGRRFALKFLLPHFCSSSDARARLQREYEVLERLTHPNIVRVFDMDQDKESEHIFLRMEYVEGNLLSQEISFAQKKRGKPLFPREEVIEWLEHIADALQYAHEQGVLHRDLKPGNIMFSGQKRAKVMDFGLARWIEGTSITQGAQAMGSLYYAAPEILRGLQASVGTDIYSFGVLCYEILTGELPIGRFLAPSQQVEGLSKKVDDVIEQMLQAEPTQRGDSLAQVWKELKRALRREGEGARATKTPSQEAQKNEKEEAPLAGGQVLSIKEAKAKAVYCPPGRFQMGASSSDVEAYHYEKPQHEVRLTRGFWMWQTPVTQGQFSSLMGYNPSGFPGHDHRPVEQLSWFEAAAFCNALSRLQGLEEVYLLHGSGREVTAEVRSSCAGSAYYEAKGWRLPTETEWEYACRAHATTPRYGASEMIAWYWDNSEKQTQPVAQKQANAWGLHDMLGNVYEWCYDWWSDYSLQSQADPVTSQGGSQRVQRGGCWYYRAEYCRASYRYSYAPNTCYNNLGFRIVKTHTP